MIPRHVLLAPALVLAAAGGGIAWYALTAAGIEGEAAPMGLLPLPPVPPRITTGLEYDRCLGMLASDPRGSATLARAWLERGGGDGAIHCLALSRIALGEPAPGAEQLEELASSSAAPPVAQAMLLYQAAQAWLMDGDAGRAHAAASAALALTPEDANLLIERAVAGGALRRFAEAVDDLSLALRVDGRRTDAMVLRGAALRHLGRDAEAAADIEATLALEPDNIEAFLERGILRQRRGDSEGARADWERAITLAPDSATADLARQNLALLEAGPLR